MQDLLLELLVDRRVPKLKMTDFNTIREITLTDRGLTVIRAAPLHFDALQANICFLTRRNIEYRGEGTAHYGMRVLTTLLLPERTDVMVGSGSGVCNECGASSGRTEMDHIIPVSLCSNGEGQLLCKNGCHADKSLSESLQHKHAR